MKINNKQKHSPQFQHSASKFNNTHNIPRSSSVYSLKLLILLSLFSASIPGTWSFDRML